MINYLLILSSYLVINRCGHHRAELLLFTSASHGLYCAAAMDDDRLDHADGGLQQAAGCLRLLGSSSSDVSISNITCTSLYPQVCTSS